MFRTSSCPDCDSDRLSRRSFLKATGAGAATAVLSGRLLRQVRAETTPRPAPETAVKSLYDALSPEQRREVCFAWDYQDPQRGLLRTRVSNNWHITKPAINSDFYTADQRRIIRDIFEGLIQPEWQAKIDRQLKDDAGGFGQQQNIAVFGEPGSGKFEFVMTGRHMTLRCDGNSAEHVAFGGPIFYGHAASGFSEKPDHPGNVFWEQAVAANRVYEMLDARQRKLAEVKNSPREEDVGFRGTPGPFPGIPLTELSEDQKQLVQQTLQKLLEPYRQGDRDEVTASLAAQGGLDKCALAFYTDPDLGGIACGTTGVWKVRRSFGTSAVPRTFTSG